MNANIPTSTKYDDESDADRVRHVRVMTVNELMSLKNVQPTPPLFDKSYKPLSRCKIPKDEETIDLTFQETGFHMDGDGIVYAKGRTIDGESVGAIISGHYHSFYISRQIAFSTDEDACVVLHLIEKALKLLATNNWHAKNYLSSLDQDDEQIFFFDDTTTDHPFPFDVRDLDIAASYKRTFKYPDPALRSAKFEPRTVRLNGTFGKPDMNDVHSIGNNPDSGSNVRLDSPLFVGWKYEERKTMFGKLPDDWRERMLLVHVLKPNYATLISRFLESDFWRWYYSNNACRYRKVLAPFFPRTTDERGNVFVKVPDASLDVRSSIPATISMLDYTKGHFMRTFEATLKPGLVFRTHNRLVTARWWTVRVPKKKHDVWKRDLDAFNALPDAYSRGAMKNNYPPSFPKTGLWIAASTCVWVDVNDVGCDLTRDANANFCTLSFDIETLGKKSKRGDSRFPITDWTQTKYIDYAKSLSIDTPPPFTANRFYNNATGNTNNGHYACDNDFGSDPFSLHVFEEVQNEDVDDDTAKRDANKKWYTATNGWSNDRWRRWLQFELEKMSTKPGTGMKDVSPADPSFKTMLAQIFEATGESDIESLLPDERDTDACSVICTAMRVEGSDENLSFCEKRAFVLRNPNAPNKIPDVIKYYEDGKKSPVWNFQDIRIQEYESEAEMIVAFLVYRRSISPDFISSWNGKSYFDIPSLWDRLQHLSRFPKHPRDRIFSQDVNFGAIVGPNVVSTYDEQFTSSNAGGDRLSRNVSETLFIHNDGLLIRTNPSFGEKKKYNSLDASSMDTLVYPKDATEAATARMIADGAIDFDAIVSAYARESNTSIEELKKGYEVRPVSSLVGASNDEIGKNYRDWTESKASIDLVTKACTGLFSNFPQRKMQFEVEKCTESFETGGEDMLAQIIYCYVDACLPALIGGKMFLQVAMARVTNVTMEEIFGGGVQQKVLALIYYTTKTDFDGIFVVPDYGSLSLHWPCVFHDLDVGCEKAALDDPRLVDEIRFTRLKKAMAKKRKEMSDGRSKKSKVTKKEKRLGYSGAEVIVPKYVGFEDALLYTLDFGSLYPSIMQANQLCYTTFLTSRLTAKYGFESFEYSNFFMGTEDKIRCGELVIDAAEAESKGYDSARLKRSRFYIEPDQKSVYECLVSNMKTQRNVSKKAMADAKRMIASLMNGKFDPPEGSIYKKMRDEGADDKTILRLLESERDIQDNAQNSFKVCNNSTYGFPGVNSLKAILPCMEISATVTCIGRLELRRSKVVSQRFDGRWIADRYLKIVEKLFTDPVSKREKKSTSLLSSYKERIQRHVVLRDDEKGIEKKLVNSPYDITPELVSKTCRLRGDRERSCRWKSNPFSFKRAPLIPCDALLNVKDDDWRNTLDVRISFHANEVLYGDTDSIMVRTSKKHFPKTSRGYKRAWDGGMFTAYHINKYQLKNMSIVFEKISAATKLDITKKTYMMRLVNRLGQIIGQMGDPGGDPLEKGISVKRDILPFVQRIIHECKIPVLDAVAAGRPLAEVRKSVIDTVHDRMNKLYLGEVNLNELTLSKKMSRMLYKTVTDHVAVAKKNESRGIRAPVGSTIFYTYVSNPPSQHELDSFGRYLKDKTAWKRSNAMLLRNNKKTSSRMTNGKKVAASKSIDADSEPFFCRIDPKGREVAEDANFVEKENIPLNLSYIHQHRIKKITSSFFAHLIAPDVETIPFLDEDGHSFEEVTALKAERKRAMKIRIARTDEILFKPFEEKIRKRDEAILFNATRAKTTLSIEEDEARRVEEKTIRESSAGIECKEEKDDDDGTPRFKKTVQQNLDRFALNNDASLGLVIMRYRECVVCKDLPFVDIARKEYTRDVRTTESKGILPSIVCEKCDPKILETYRELEIDREEIYAKKRELNQYCKACVYLLDNPTVDVSKCKSSLCSIFNAKKETTNHLNRVEKKMGTLECTAKRKHVKIRYDDNDEEDDDEIVQYMEVEEKTNEWNNDV